MSTIAGSRNFGSSRDGSIPPLEDGVRLSRAEFERRYEAMTGLKRAELIEGIVSMPSPVHFGRHGIPHGRVVAWLGNYQAGTPGVEYAPEATVRLDAENEFQPDAILLIRPENGGLATLSGDDYLEGAPELVVEVSSSTAGIDLGKKLVVYCRNGVREYIVWKVPDRRIDWFIARDGSYARLEPDDHGIYRSGTFPGLWLDRDAMLRYDTATVLETLRQGMAGDEHRRFVERLAK
jgi:Uma2 family endonuclease